MERRACSKHLVGADDQSRIQFSDEFDGDGDALFNACAEKGLEGIVSKMHLHLIDLVEARLGSRPNASRSRPLW
jgi:ATP-dependent DNA ligase